MISTFDLKLTCSIFQAVTRRVKKKTTCTSKWLVTSPQVYRNENSSLLFESHQFFVEGNRPWSLFHQQFIEETSKYP